jgi:hypothetical protein
MRESEIRQRIETVLRRRLQAMLAPALSVGLGLSTASCSFGGSGYGAQFPGPPDGAYGAQFPRDSAIVDKPMRTDNAPDVASVVDVPVDAPEEDVPLGPDLSSESAGEAASSEAHADVDDGTGSDT